MRIFEMRTLPHGIERFQQFRDEKFVCIGWPGIGDLSDVSKDELRKRIASAYKSSGHKLGYALGQVNSFVNVMQRGDVVIVENKGWAYIATVGDYTYEERYDNDNDGMCHRRNVEWIAKLPQSELNPSIQSLLRNRNTIAEYPHSIEESGLGHILSGVPLALNTDKPRLDDLFEIALHILEEELKSDNPDRRLRAATELIRLKTR